MKDIPLTGAKLMYLYDLTNCTLHALTAYTVKLKEEYDLLKKKQKSKKTSKTKIVKTTRKSNTNKGKTC